MFPKTLVEKVQKSPVIAVLAVGGSWLVPRKLIQQKDWDQISKNCEKATEIVYKLGGSNG